MKILITGSTGQLGKTLIKDLPNLLSNKKINILAPSRKEFDLTDIDECMDFLYKNDPQIIINCAAYTNVEKAEIEQKIAKNVNSKAPYFFAKYIDNNQGQLIQISTDYVFDGNQNFPYHPYSKTNPLSTYGATKLLGEKFIESFYKF